MRAAITRLPPTSTALANAETRPYFIWWADVTVGDLRRLLQSADSEERAYWMGALLREANTRDVWQFVSPDEVRRSWPMIRRHLGRTAPMWEYLLEIPATEWPPPESRRAPALR